MKRLALAALFAACLVAVPAPAHAANSANFYHYTPDNGYNGAFSVSCDDGYGTRMVYEGQRSDCPNGVNSIYVFPGSEVWCRYRSIDGTFIWYKAFDATGSHSTKDTLSTTCVTQTD